VVAVWCSGSAAWYPRRLPKDQPALWCRCHLGFFGNDEEIAISAVIRRRKRLAPVKPLSISGGGKLRHHPANVVNVCAAFSVAGVEPLRFCPDDLGEIT